ncbi:hypothetical protein BJ741DRAFT_337820 [Chytriomyces cf. hyalinus JEL632]|nr:hypothetical protein BJ741DRAFT_337820 [Chytriomyces cf. hyalinus JEL632]
MTFGMQFRRQSLILSLRSLLDSNVSALEGFMNERAALIKKEAAKIKKEGDIEAARINERAALASRVEQFDEIITGVTRNMKKLMDESDLSSSNSKRSSVSKRDTKKQAAFKASIVARDKRCILTESMPVSCEAAHIIPWTFHRDNEAIWADQYGPHCLNPLDAAFDVRNGILMRDDLNGLFEMFLFTIVPLTGDRFQVNVSDLDERVPPEVLTYNGRMVSFEKRFCRYVCK